MAEIQVQAPDGSIIQFAAGTPDATINSVMAREFGGLKTATMSSAAGSQAPGETVSAFDPMGSATGAAEAAPAPVANIPYRAQMGNALGAIDNGVRAVANGIPFMDRIAAGGAALTGIGGEFGDYSGNLDRERARNKALEESAPAANTAAHFVGGSLVPMGAVGAAAGRAGLLAKSLMGAGVGAGIGGVQGLSETPDLTDLPDAAKHTAIGAGTGALVGGAIPVAGKVIGKSYNVLADALTKPVGISRGSSKHLIDALGADTVPTVQQRMNTLGPDAMLADAGPAFLGKAQGASLNSDEGRSVLQGALNTRNEGTNQRIMGDVNRALGPAEDPQTVTNFIRQHRSDVDNVAYPAALENAPAVRTANILTQLDDMIPRSVGNEQRALTNLRDMMMTTERRPLLDAHGYPQYDRLGNERFHDVPVSQNDAEVLHKVKQELDNVIEYDAPGLGVPAGALTRQQGVLKHMRGQLNEALENQVPGYMEANRQSAALARRGQAVEEGTQYLGAGKTTPSPGRFADEFAHREFGEQIAFAKGSRGDIDRKLGTKANDLQALKSELQGEGGWNTDKIATVHGREAADELMSSVERNLKFRDTHNKVVENSQTAQRTAAANAMKPEPPGEMPLINPNMTTTGLLLAGLKKGAGHVWSGMQGDPTRHYGEMARVLSAQGPERDRHLAALIDALAQRGQNARMAPIIGDRAALAAALAGNDYLRGQTGAR